MILRSLFNQSYLRGEVSPALHADYSMHTGHSFNASIPFCASSIGIRIETSHFVIVKFRALRILASRRTAAIPVYVSGEVQVSWSLLPRPVAAFPSSRAVGRYVWPDESTGQLAIGAPDLHSHSLPTSHHHHNPEKKCPPLTVAQGSVKNEATCNSGTWGKE